MRTLLITLLFILVSCGESPLFNHEMEKNFSRENFSLSQSVVYEFQKSNYSFSIDWTEGPLKGESKFILRTWNKTTGTLSGPFKDVPNTLHIFLWMPSMGHGSSPVKITKLGDGEYEVSNVYFIMGGAWQIKFQILSSGKVVDETVISLTL